MDIYFHKAHYSCTRVHISIDNIYLPLTLLDIDNSGQMQTKDEKVLVHHNYSGVNPIYFIIRLRIQEANNHWIN